MAEGFLRAHGNGGGGFMGGSESESWLEEMVGRMGRMGLRGGGGGGEGGG